MATSVEDAEEDEPVAELGEVDRLAARRRVEDLARGGHAREQRGRQQGEEDGREEELARARADGHGAEEGPGGGDADRPEDHHDGQRSGDGGRSTWKRSATSGTTTTSTARRKASTPAALPHQMAARGMGDTRRPTSADSSRSRCQVRPRASTEEKAMASQSAPGATRVVVSGPVAKATLARIATSAAKKAAS